MRIERDTAHTLAIIVVLLAVCGWQEYRFGRFEARQDERLERIEGSRIEHGERLAGSRGAVAGAFGRAFPEPVAQGAAGD